MKQLYTGIAIGFLFFAAACNQSERYTAVYLVRHAEKVTGRGLRNPDLTEAGHARADRLAEVLGSEKISRIYTTSYLRNRATVAPLASALCVVPETYEWEESKALAASLRELAGTSVLVCGHVDNILPMLEAMGCKAPVDSIGAETYGQIFIARLSPNGKCSVEIKTY